MTLPWIVGSAVAGMLAGPPLRVGVLARYGVKPPAFAVEAAAGLTLAAVAARSPSPSLWQLAALGWLMLCAVALAFIDIAIRRLPDPLTGAALAGTLCLLTIAALTGGGHPGQLGRAVIAAAALCGFYLALFIVRPSGMGLGDVKLAASVGVALGWLGWQSLVAGTFLTFALAAAYGIALLLLRRASRTSQLPLGPFIVLGTLAAIAV
jgi:leader peptidase (prepilin peptidase) / N-methyltransferase